MPRAGPKKKAANGYKLPEPLPAGEVLEDVAKKKWKLGPSVGQGGFGEIYSAQEAGSTGAKYPCVIKIEPHANGPLFVEMHFYMKNAKPEDVEAFKTQKGLKTFGMPVYLGSGSHEFNGEKYRFIVTEKFGTDLWNIFLEHNRHFPTTTVFKIAIQILDVLEYIHSKGYIHADVKGSNILLGITKDTQNKQVYLVDFGLAAKCNEEEEFKPNPKKAHDGTIEYLSRDAHKGVQTKRGDLETLAYNLIQWLGCVLPWEKNLKDPKEVQKIKEEYMASVPKFIKACFDKRSPPGPIVDFLNCLSTLEHNSDPDYKTIRKIFLSGLTSGDTLGKPFEFAVPDRSPPKMPPVKRKNEDNPATSKRKQAKKGVDNEASEDEKENFDDLSDTEEVIKKPAKNKKRGKKATLKKRTKKELPEEDDENETIEDNDDNFVVEEEIVSGPSEPKGKNKSNAKKKMKKVVQEEELIDNGDNEEHDIVTSRKNDHTELKEKPKGRGRKKAAKELNGEAADAEEETVPDVAQQPARATRQRGRPVNYKEDSDDERKPSRKKAKNTNTKEVHVTGDTEGYTDAMKQVAKKKNEKAKKKAESQKVVTEEEDQEEDVGADQVTDDSLHF